MPWPPATISEPVMIAFLEYALKMKIHYGLSFTGHHGEE
jgi:hypothetical protein